MSDLNKKNINYGALNRFYQDLKSHDISTLNDRIDNIDVPEYEGSTTIKISNNIIRTNGYEYTQSNNLLNIGDVTESVGTGTVLLVSDENNNYNEANYTRVKYYLNITAEISPRYEHSCGYVLQDNKIIATIKDIFATDDSGPSKKPAFNIYEDIDLTNMTCEIVLFTNYIDGFNGVNSILLGNHLESGDVSYNASNKQEIIIGKYNATTKLHYGDATPLFILGTGSNNNRKNALVTYEGGDLYVNGLGYDGTSPITPSTKTLQQYIAALEARIYALEHPTTVE